MAGGLVRAQSQLAKTGKDIEVVVGAATLTATGGILVGRESYSGSTSLSENKVHVWCKSIFMISIVCPSRLVQVDRMLGSFAFQSAAIQNSPIYTGESRPVLLSSFEG